MPKVFVHLLPELVEPDTLRGSTCVVIDLLRATTTITYALAAGAERVIPCLTVEQARETATGLKDLEPLLGGERGGVRIEGFDLGNSPAEYTPERVGGQTIVFTTTNGTKAMDRGRRADQILLAAAVNLSAVVRELQQANTVQILCAGTQNAITREDVLLAGGLAEKLSRSHEIGNDSARIAQAAWREIFGPSQSAAPTMSGRLTTELRDTQGGRNLIELGLEADLVDTAQVDRFDFVPELDLDRWEVRRSDA